MKQIKSQLKVILFLVVISKNKLKIFYYKKFLFQFQDSYIIVDEIVSTEKKYKCQITEMLVFKKFPKISGKC